MWRTKPGTIYFRPAVARVVREAVPGVAFYALQGQVSVGVMMLLGSPLAIASIGALSRVGAVYALLGPLIDNVVAPRYARLGGGRLSVVYRQLILPALAAAALLTVLLLLLAAI